MFGERTWTRLVSQSCHGRVTIPIEFRRSLGILDAETLEMAVEDGELRIRRVAPPARSARAAIHSDGSSAKGSAASDPVHPIGRG